MAAKRKGLLMLLVALVAGGAFYWFKFRPLGVTDALGNKIRFGTAKVANGDTEILVNGSPRGTGTLGTLQLINGFAHMKTANGKLWKFTGTSAGWVVVGG